ncbi:HAMP domain-containing histidine kinase [bacterium SCSIO 12741]|nr:HAMP domain-containing histidine kinase [bacterium SCSIO 12741]
MDLFDNGIFRNAWSSRSSPAVVKPQGNTIQFRLLLAFLFFTLIIVFMSGVSAYYLWEVEKVNAFNTRLQNMRSSTQQLINRDAEILHLELINTEFYETASTPAIIQRDQLTSQIENNLEWVIDNQVQHQQLGFPDLSHIRAQLDTYNRHFRAILEKQRERGFKNHGLEGEMRQYAHRLEDPALPIDLDKVLSLRRHEKDFFLRNDTAYILRLNQLCNKILADLAAEEQQAGLVEGVALITNYQATFNQLVKVQQEIGLKNQTGMTQMLDFQRNILSNQFYAASQASQERTEAIMGKIRIQYAVTCLICIVLSFVLSLVISAYISRPIRRLSDFMRRFILNHVGRSDLKTVEMESAPYEVKNLARSFSEMTRQLRKQYHEISDKKIRLEDKNAELTKLNGELDRFVYSVSHDLRAPLTSLLGLIDLTEMDCKDETTQGYLGMMRTSVQQMDTFIEDILSFSRNRSQEVVVETIDIEGFIRELYEQNSFSLNDQVDLSLSSEILTSFYSDKQRLRMIFNNLMSNAIRYRDLNKPITQIRAQIQVTEKEAFISLSDNGIGIDKAHQEKIFDKFFRASERSKGSGLGLFIVKEAVEKLNGGIEVKSELGTGTTFLVRIPNLNPNASISEPKAQKNATNPTDFQLFMN